MSQTVDQLSLQERKSLGLSTSLVIAWLITGLACLGLNIARLPWWILIAIVVIRTLLQTGLFIVGHDAMHGVLWPGRRQFNDRLGALVLLLYAALPYRRCSANHRRHHRSPASLRDPDFPSHQSTGPVGWYGEFMAEYLSLSQMTVLIAGWAALIGVFTALTPTAARNVLLFCTLPLLLSSLQLFVVGTYLPHRSQRHPHGQPHPGSLDLPVWLSFLACFHFGYHREHHDHPELPWFALPTARCKLRALALSKQPL